MGQVVSGGAEGGCREDAPVRGEETVWQTGEEVECRIPWCSGPDGVEEGAEGSGVWSCRLVPLHSVGVEGGGAQLEQRPWFGCSEAREVRVQELLLLGWPVPQRGERCAAVREKR